VIIDYNGIYKNIVKKCYISEGYTDYNDLVIILNNGTSLSGDYSNMNFIFEETINNVVRTYVEHEHKSLIRKRKIKINKLIG
jgi:hypothetical protein